MAISFSTVREEPSRVMGMRSPFAPTLPPPNPMDLGEVSRRDRGGRGELIVRLWGGRGAGSCLST